MYGAPYNWPRQNWKVKPGPKTSSNARPTSVASVAWLKRDVGSVFANSTDANQSYNTCRADVHHGQERRKLDGVIVELALEDMLGNAVDLGDCDVILDDESREVKVVVEDGVASFVYAWQQQQQREDAKERSYPVTDSHLDHAPVATIAAPTMPRPSPTLSSEEAARTAR
ncbi:hypothetical protein QQS21_008625 [Conoideocrella luteorostrata]|uniref:Uncharacterized protein n=1 Tax=Conoideocrella luteorostrata TaxID=1105319 RepID=A0AAJ0FR97_9HYPO|nr:hypothetical protein QQS21_008625 [Conoideocrella luteorostrata]